MDKVFAKAQNAIRQAAKKFTSVSVSRGKTVFPKAPKDLENIGIRFDFDGEVDIDGETHNKLQVQPNAGKVPTWVRNWRDKNGGTHAVMGTMYVKKNGSVEDVENAFEEFAQNFKD